MESMRHSRAAKPRRGRPGGRDRRMALAGTLANLSLTLLHRKNLSSDENLQQSVFVVIVAADMLLSMQYSMLFLCVCFCCCFHLRRCGPWQ